jgi:hypothetical protein
MQIDPTLPGSGPYSQRAQIDQPDRSVGLVDRLRQSA